jgi:hypothetical protein
VAGMERAHRRHEGDCIARPPPRGKLAPKRRDLPDKTGAGA